MRRYDTGCLNRLGIDPKDCFFVLTRSQVQGLADEARAQGYRKPANANGSTARYFYARLQREMSK